MSLEIAKEFMEVDRVIFGKIKNVTDKERYTLSFEIPQNNDYKTKIKTESPYHELTNGGHMTEICINNKVEETIRYMNDMDVGFAKINMKK